MQNYWAFHNSKMIELRKKYDKIDRQTRNRLQEIFNRFEITADNLYSYVSKDVKKQVNAYIEEWSEKKIDDEYFKVLMMTVLTKDRVTYAEILELFIYEAYIEQQMKEKDEEDSLFYTDINYYYRIGQLQAKQKSNKEISVLEKSMFLYLLSQPVFNGYTFAHNIKVITMYNAGQIYKQCLINIQQGIKNNINDLIFENIIKKQQNAKLCINNDKISGFIDSTMIGINNKAIIEGIKIFDKQAKVKFISDMCDNVTCMCKNLNGMEFYIDKENIFDRYWGETAKELKLVRVKTNGLILGVNLPPIRTSFSLVSFYYSIFEK